MPVKFNTFSGSEFNNFLTICFQRQAHIKGFEEEITGFSQLYKHFRLKSRDAFIKIMGGKADNHFHVSK